MCARTCAIARRNRAGKAAASPFGPARERHLVDEQQLVPALGHQPGLETLAGAEHEDLRHRARARAGHRRPRAADSHARRCRRRREGTSSPDGDDFRARLAPRWMRIAERRRAMPRSSGGCRRRDLSRRAARCRRGRAGRRAALASASGSERANESSTPEATSTDSSDVPPCDMNGSGTPSTGKTRSTTPMLMSAWPTIQTVMRARDDAHERVVGLADDVEGADGEQREQREDDGAADQAELLADDREDVVVRGGGKPVVLLLASCRGRGRRSRRRRGPRCRAAAGSSRRSSPRGSPGRGSS